MIASVYRYTLGSVLAAVLLGTVFCRSGYAAVPSCIDGIRVFRVVDRAKSDAVELRDLHDHPHYVMKPPLFVVTSDMVASVRVTAYGLSGPGEGLKSLENRGIPTNYFPVVITLKQNAQAQLRRQLAAQVPTQIAMVCGSTVMSSVPLLSPLIEGFDLAGFTTRAEADAVTKTIGAPVQTQLTPPLITAGSVNGVALGDSLATVAHKLPHCNLLLLTLDSLPPRWLAVHADCYAAVQMLLAVDASGRVREIRVLGGEAHTANGVGIGTEVAKLIARTGTPNVETRPDAVCLRFPNEEGIAFCLRPEDAKHYLEHPSTPAALPSTGQIGSIIVGRRAQQ